MESENRFRESVTYTLGRPRERNFIGRIPMRTAMVVLVGVLVFVVSMMAQQVKFALTASVLFGVVGVLVHFQRDGRSMVTAVRLIVTDWWRQATGEAQYHSGPESRVAGGHRRLPGLLASTELVEGVDANGYVFGVIVNPVDKTATVKLTGQLTGDVLRSEDEDLAASAEWGRCEEQWAHNTNLLLVVSRESTRPATGQLARREVDTIVSPDAPTLARQIQYQRAELLHAGGQDREFEIAFTLAVSMSHANDYSFLDQLRYEILPLYSGALPWAGIEARPMTGDEIVASARQAVCPASEQDFEQLAVEGAAHELPWVDAGPTTAYAGTKEYFHDGVWSRVWEMVDAPPSTFQNKHLAPLLAHHERLVRKTVCLVYRPFPPGEAHSLVEAEHIDAMVGVNDGKTLKSVKAEMRLETTKESRKALAKGSGYGRRSMYVMSTRLPGDDPEAIEKDFESLASQINVRTRPMDRMQDAAFSMCLGVGASGFDKAGRK